MKLLRTLPLMAAFIGAGITGCGSNNNTPPPKPIQIVGSEEPLTIEGEKTIAFDDDNDKVLSEAEIRRLGKEVLGIKASQVTQEDVNKLIIIRNLFKSGHNQTSAGSSRGGAYTVKLKTLEQTLENFQKVINKYQERVDLLKELESKR